MCVGDPVHAGDKALTRETPAQRGRVNRYACTSMEKCSRLQVDIIYTAPKVLTELHVHLWKCAVDYR